MADTPENDNRTEAPSPRKREEAHEQGQFAFSAELMTGAILFLGVGGLYFLAQSIGSGLLTRIRQDLSAAPPDELTPELVRGIFGTMFQSTLMMCGSLLALLIAGTIGVNMAQAGFHFNPTRLMPDFEKKSFFEFSRVLSWSKIVSGLILVLKVVAVGAVAWWVLRGRIGEVVQLGDATLPSAVMRCWGLVIHLALALAGTLLVIGGIDYGFQWWRFEKSISMSKQELKEEMKREEGDPLIKARIRRMQREISQRKMFQQVPKATVVITNPTHLAIAIQYEPGKMAAPKVIAKGAGHVAKRIVELARKHGIIVMERKPLAQALFKTVKVDREIPFALYVVVAELLAYVYKLKGGVTP